MEETSIAETTADTTPVEEGAQAFIDLYAGNELSSEEADSIALRFPVHLVVFAGPAASGKTTILASVYERFNEGSFAGYEFAGSRSLLGFEQICYLNRLASGATRPDTPRTVPSDEAAYYHLCLLGVGIGAQRRHVLLSAISGELFRLASNSREDCERLSFINRANTLVVLVDGARLVDSTQRTSAQSEAAGILESVLDAKMLGRRCRVEFVCSKFDRVIEAGDAAVEFLNMTESKLRARFESRVPLLTFRRIAARPEVEPSTVSVADGLAEAFTAWTTRDDVDTYRTPQDAPPRDAREFAKYGWRCSVRES